MVPPLSYVLAAFVGYLIGAFPTGVVLTRISGRPDPRFKGSGHTGGLNVSRMGGLALGVLTAAVDASKGVVALTFCRLLVPGDLWVIPIAGVAAVVGHNWSPFIGFYGGIGLSLLFGLFLLLQPLVIPVVFLAWLVLYLALRHRPRSMGLAILVLGPTLLLLSQPEHLVALGFLASIPVFLKHVPDFGKPETPVILPPGA
ncbi:MAG: glycerol-3-phosphate acyltransferase [Chloroflexi bacterium]|nr:glycerol-3-phosphate acyltransferase [Chloroflexota bacterium]